MAMNGNGDNGHAGKSYAGRRELMIHDSAVELGTSVRPPLGSPEIEWGAPQEQMSLAMLWHLLMKRRWTIVTAALVVTVVAAIVSFRMQAVYRATASVEVEAETPMIQSLNDLVQRADNGNDDNFLQTQIQVIKSENLAWRTIQQLRLEPSLIRPEKLANIPEKEHKVGLISEFQDHLKVSLVPKTRMLTVAYEDRDPALAAQVATTLVNNYIDYNFRQKYDATRQASGWMEQQLDELKAKVEKSQQSLVNYEREYQIVNSNEKQNVLEQMLSDLSRDLTAAESDRVAKEAQYKEVQADRLRIAALAHNDLLQKLEENAADLTNQYADVVTQYGPKHPRVERLQQQLNENRAQIEREQNRVIERIRNDYRAAMGRERLAAAAVANQKAEVGKLSQLLVQHNILQREFESNQQMYQSLLQKLKDATVSAGLRSANLHMVDAALPPTVPVRPRRAMNIAIGFLAGVILGIMGAFAQEGLDRSIRSAEELEALLGTPALAVIPRERQRSLPRPNGNGAAAGSNVALAMVERPQSVLAEAYRALRTSVLLSLAQNAPKILLVTSTQPGEGKTATAVNLAQALAQQKGPILLMDCDLRKGGIAAILRLDKRHGVTTVLTGNDTLENVLQPHPAQPNLFVMTAGPNCPNPAELMASDAMRELCGQLAERFQHVIIDSPPILAVTDGTILSTLADGVLLVAESGVTPKGGLVRTVTTLGNAGARILGVVLNKLDARRDGYYGSGGYYYYNRSYSKHPYGYGGDRADA